MAAENVKDALDELSTTRYKDFIPETEDEVEAIAEFEHALRWHTTKQSMGHSQRCLVLQQLLEFQN